MGFPYSVPASQATDAEVAASIETIIAGASATNDTFAEVEALLALKAPLASPSFTGSPVFTSGATVKGTTSVVSLAQLAVEGGQSGYGAGLKFTSMLGGSSTIQDMAKIVADGESAWNTTAGTQLARLSFWTQNAGTLTEWMRLTSLGKLGLGSTNPLGKFESRATSGMQAVLSYDATHYAGFTVNSAGKLIISSVGTPEIVLGSAITDKLGFYGLSTGVAQPAHADQAAVATTTPTLASYGFTLAQATAIIALVNRLRLDLVNVNLIKGSA